MQIFKKRAKNLIRESVDEVKKDVIEQYKPVIYFAGFIALLAFMFPNNRDGVTIVHNYYKEVYIHGKHY